MEPVDTIVLPAAPTPPARGALPLIAAIVPVVSGAVLFAVTGSPLTLCFAALGPVMILGSFLDGVRQRRRALRAARGEEAQSWERVEETVARRETEERGRRVRMAPDLAGCLEEPPTRAVALAPGIEVSVGRGDGPSPLRFSGTGERAEDFRAQHRNVSGVPVTAPLAEGLCVRGPAPVAAAVARALLLQLCLRHAAGAIRLEGDGVAWLGMDDLAGHGGLPAVAAGVHVGRRRTASSGPRICVVAPGDPPPAGYHAVLDVADPGLACLRIAEGARVCAAEGVSREQAEVIVRDLVRERGAAAGIPGAVALREVLASADGHGDAGGTPGGPHGLPAVLGRDADAAVVVDLVADGPHALVTGVTGAGKSELLVSWVAALAAAHPVERVSFVLADFKGGAAFEPLRSLPHVAAIITDLDADGAARGVRSLRAELRRREALLAASGVRSIAEARGDLGRLVIVVDEFAALLQEHPDLAAVFTDIAARGRALGMHLVLGTQRATGVIRDALAANCPLRIALRVTDAADSRVMIGTDQAAGLPGDLAGRGLACIRRAQDTAPAAFRVARTGPEEIAEIAVRWPGALRARSPWLPALPTRLRRADLPGCPAGELVIGLADEPDRQRQEPRTLRIGHDRGLTVFGGPGSGKSTALRNAVEQVTDSLLLPGDPERAWALLDELSDGRRPLPALLAVDDLDRHLAAFPHEYAAAWAEKLQRVLRIAAECGGTVLLSASRCSAQVSSAADLLPARMLLRAASRTEHLTAGGDPRTYDPGRTPGRGVLDGVEVQVAVPDRADADGRAHADDAPVWQPRAPLVGLVSTTPARTADALSRCFGRGVVQLLTEGAPVIVTDGTRASDDLALIVGDADAWQRQYALWQRVMRTGEAVVLAEAGRELRTLAGVRELPPYALTHAGRAWTVNADGRPSRVILPAPRDDVSPAARPAV
ncbi:FtsK/SpoIIIE domain-containing protein [Microbacterium azadirachtae]|uniref:ESX-1 secretion system protein EccCa1 n=1 Tax=Microbacterium azadirachtae TaxID=582680 RepID=A0A0F0KGY9_9MICO|nr:FtsK/SpoIIIE domain-containing protein [Microbacterium azadirachtae]KJL19405.1 ESX-1 secretion system protein EccCa1 [Microbacterium azadirachtae]SDL44645.1 FtsK/SpoIIIE family protein [Microbacterium azadirachtae]SEF74960.1 FtsK/SpoIIIE family protein [Microbacterium azadirachtae]SEF75799.1 FtsK/SpoIIIE family protein [Microbacterium azadirachtae]